MKILILIFYVFFGIPVFGQDLSFPCRKGSLDLEKNLQDVGLTTCFNSVVDLVGKVNENTKFSESYAEIHDYNNGHIYWIRVNENYSIYRKAGKLVVTSPNRQAEAEANFLAKLEKRCPTPLMPKDESKEFKRAKVANYRDSVRNARWEIGKRLLDSCRKQGFVSEEYYRLCSDYLRLKQQTYPTPNTSMLYSTDDIKRQKRIQNLKLLFTNYYQLYILNSASPEMLTGDDLAFYRFRKVIRSFDKKDSSFEKEAQDYLATSSDEDYKLYIRGLMEQQKKEQDGMLTAYDGRKLTLKEILNAYRNKVIYIDFWATWCAPCIAEMPNSVALHKKVPQVVFIYLSLDSDINTWREGVKSLGLKRDNCFLIDRQKGSSITRQLGVKSIPRYFIYDKQGKLVNGNAPRPSSEKKLVKIFEQLMGPER